MTTDEIVRALRICVHVPDNSGGDCYNCPAVGSERCMTETMNGAADLIEQLTAENVVLPEGQASAIESLRKEIEWKDMVIALAQRKQAEAEAERDALREKVPQWVSVEDTERLPLPGTRVIATDGVFVGEAYRGKLGEWRRYDDCLCWFDAARQAVTHWVPLPEAPEAPKGGEKA